MNKPRRKRLEEIAERLEDIKSELEDIQSEEEAYRDNMPENLQGSERYERADAACDALGDAVSSMEDAIGSIESATE